MSSSDNLDTGIVVFCTNGNVMFSSNGELIQSTKKVRSFIITIVFVVIALVLARNIY